MTLKIIENDKNVSKMPYYDNLQMFFFGGNGTSVEIENIDSVFLQYWYPNEGNSIPCLMIKLKNGVNISVDYDTTEEALEALNLYKKNCLIKAVKNEEQ